VERARRRKREYRVFSDGAYKATGRIKDFDGKWVILEDGRLKIDVTIIGTTRSTVNELEFIDEDAIITDSDGKSTRYTRQN
jgi:hypothetical protein